MIKTLFNICRQYWLPLIIFLVGGISQSFIGQYSIVYFQRLLDQVIEAQTFADIQIVLFWYIGLTALNHVLIYLEGYPSNILRHGAYQWVKLRAMKKIMGIDFLAYQNLGTGNLIQLVENGASATRGILMGFYLDILRGVLPGLIITFMFIRFYDETLFLVILGSYVILFLLSYYLMIFLRREMDKMLDSQEDFSKFSVRGFMELVVFRVNNRFKQEYERVKNISDDIVRSQAKIYLVQELFFTGFAFLIFLIEVAVIIQQTNKIIAGTSTVGTLVALTQFVGMAVSPISHFSVAYVNYKRERVAFQRFQDFLDIPEDEGLNKADDLKISQGEVVFKNVDFAFGEKPIFQDLSLIFAGGQTTALVGASGSGKSTMVRVLLHLLKPQTGAVYVDDQNLADVNLVSFYRQVAYIPQEPPIFDGTIRENLTFDAPISDADLQAIIQQIGLVDFIANLPDGLETVVGERGIKLSGGERQRLAFGRVLVQAPKIVILDEPTSALDSLTEKFVTQNLHNFLAGKTVIMIAHRLQTVKSADSIVVLEGGQVIQSGRFEELVNIDGKFQTLWAEQTNDDSPTTNREES
ncbi:MAG: ABC transporter ATP-binding protein [Chloroflexota bacterium]